MSPLEERIGELKGWAMSRIRTCREQEAKFSNAWQMREKHQHGPPQALVEAWTERRALESALEILDPGYVARVDKLIDGIRTTHPISKGQEGK